MIGYPMEMSGDTRVSRVSRSGRVLKKSKKLEEFEELDMEEAHPYNRPASELKAVLNPRQKVKQSRSFSARTSTDMTFVISLKGMFEDVAYSVAKWYAENAVSNSIHTQAYYLRDVPLSGTKSELFPPRRDCQRLRDRCPLLLNENGIHSSYSGYMMHKMAMGHASHPWTSDSGNRIAIVQPRRKEPKAISEAIPAQLPASSCAIGIAPKDVAAHLILLGHCITQLGQRVALMEKEPPPTGVYSVLLDTLLCAVGPLMCLTRHVAGLENLPEEPFMETLDHIAYFLPGL